MVRSNPIGDPFKSVLALITSISLLITSTIAYFATVCFTKFLNLSYK
jgi:hypothetical protein